MYIQQLMPSMSNGEKKIAEFILAQRQDIVYMTVGQVADRLSVADSSVVRFCRMLGLSGFTELKIRLAQHTSKPPAPIPDDIDAGDDIYTITNKVFASSIKTLQDTMGILDKQQLEETVALLLAAEKIEIYGIGTSASLALDAYYRLMRIGLPAYAVTDPAISRHSASRLGPGCVALGISHTGRTKDTVDTLKIAKKRGAKVIGITSFFKSPLADTSDHLLVISSNEADQLKEAVTSRLAHLALLDSLCTCVLMRQSDKLDSFLLNIGDISKQLRYT